METLIDFIDKLAGKGVKLSAVGGQLKCYAPKGSLTPDLQEGIARHKTQILAFLDGPGDAQQAAERPFVMEREFPLSAGQKGLYLLQSLHPDMGAYNVPVAFRIDGPLDTKMLAQAWECVLQQFPILTARIVEKDGALHHRLDDACKTTLQQRHVQMADDELLAFVRKEARQPFDLQRGPLTRIELFVRDGKAPVLLLTVHHIVFDGASAVMVLRALLGFYQQLCAGTPVRLSRELQGYDGFVAWEQAMLASADGAAHARYWKQQLEGELPTIEIPPDFARRPSASFEGKTVIAELPADLAQAIADCGKAHSLPPSVVFLGVFQLLLHRYTSQDDVIVGMPVMGRAAQQFAEDVGYFINMVPIRARLDDGRKMLDHLRSVRGTMLDALYHSSYPFPLMSQAASGRRSGSAIFQVLYAYQNFFKLSDVASWLPEQQGLRIDALEGIAQEGQGDLSLEIFESGPASFTIHVKYNPELYAPRTIETLAERYQVLLGAVCANPQLALHEYRMLTAREEQRLLREFNDTRTDYRNDQCLHELFLAQVEAHANDTAVISGEQSLTYRQLQERAHALALYLQAEGVKPDDLVGVCMTRSLEMVIALYGILLAGGAYVPLDPDYPDERLQHMVRDSGAAIVLTQDALRTKLAAFVTAETRVVTQWPERMDGVLAKNVKPENIAYVIYTSGSTGLPKGVMNEHRGIVNRLLWMQEAYGLDGTDAVLQKTPFSFDVSVWEFFWPLFTGATLVMAKPEGHKDPAYLTDVIRQHQITTLHFVPSMLQVFLEHDAASQCASLKRVVCSGEALPSVLVRRFAERLPHATLYNLYGPTEAAVDVTAWTCPKTDIPNAIPIGKPIANTQMYILDAYGAPVPIGVAGELFIAGVQVARGYLNREQLTAERFVKDPFSADPNARMYKTGDLARWQDDGNIEYLGRNDFQVKLRGFRIELGEIEARLTEHESIREAVVIAREDTPGDKRLVAYYTASENVADVRTFLAGRLPEYMVPSAFVMLEQMPLSPNGKLDRKALPAPDAAAPATAAYAPPQGEIETQLATIWQELLHVERVGRHDHFFELGGHSLLATQLAAKIRAQLDVDVPLTTLFEKTTIALLAEFVAAASKRKAPSIRRVDRSRYRLA
ncbi:MAG: amino acid adenylation domain-containing protein [Acidobacteria bacterium]|nr:amino acid adenylation domain-containing protein [Acidobacteriota bacterium]